MITSPCPVIVQSSGRVSRIVSIKVIVSACTGRRGGGRRTARPPWTSRGSRSAQLQENILIKIILLVHSIKCLCKIMNEFVVNLLKFILHYKKFF